MTFAEVKNFVPPGKFLADSATRRSRSVPEIPGIVSIRSSAVNGPAFAFASGESVRPIKATVDAFAGWKLNLADK